MVETINIVNKVEELHRITGELEILEEKWELSPAIAMNLNLCMEEALSNIIFYAFDDGEEHSIEVELDYKEAKEIIITLRDEGKAFNPLENAEKPDVESDVEDRQIGGLGIFFIQQFMDKVEYIRRGNTNELIMIKQL